MTTNAPKTLRLLLGDQLNSQHSWFREVNPNVIRYDWHDVPRLG
ncbi:hypothetical protein [Fibrella aquatica]